MPSSLAFDSSYDNDDLVVVFSIGNDGESGYNQVPAPALAKNVIAVGATGVTGYGTVEDENYVPYYSSRGPSCSLPLPPSPLAGRIKPDLVSAGVAHAAKAFTPTACNNECQDHTDTKVASGTYPLFFCRCVSSPHVGRRTFRHRLGRYHLTISRRRVLRPFSRLFRVTRRPDSQEGVDDQGDVASLHRATHRLLQPRRLHALHFLAQPRAGPRPNPAEQVSVARRGEK